MKKLTLADFDKPIFFVGFVSMAVIPVLFLLALGLRRVGLPGPVTLANGG